jgi:hypothetical protein
MSNAARTFLEFIVLTLAIAGAADAPVIFSVLTGE